MTEEWTAMIRRAGRWEAVGTTGDQQHARNELDDWMRDVPNGHFAVARRRVPDWTVTQEYRPGDF